MSGQHNLIDQKFWDAVTGTPTPFIIPDEILKSTRELVIYIHFLTGVTAGVIEVEGAGDPSFTGTWVSIATITWSAQNKAHKTSVTGVHKAVRIRASTPIANGNVDGVVCAD